MAFRFLLARLHMDVLETQKTKGGIKKALQSLARGEKELHKTYEQAVERINCQSVPSRELAWRILEWIIYSKSPLSTAELQHALATRESMANMDMDFLPSAKVLQSVCAGLVTIDKESDVVRLDHYTIQEFFQERGEDLLPNAAVHIAEDCLKYLSFDEFESGMCQSRAGLTERLKTHSLYNYAGQNWGHHVYEASSPCQGLIKFLKCQGRIDASLQVLLFDRYGGFDHQGHLSTLRSSTETTGLHLAAYFGLHNTIDFLLSDMQSDARDMHGRTPLHWAAENGQDAVIKLLLAQEKVDLEARDVWGQTALWIAAERDYPNVIKLLIQAKADPEARDTRGRTPLYIAAVRGRSDTVQLLLGLAQVNPDSKDRVRITPLLRVIGKGYQAVVKQLLSTDKVDVNAKDVLGQTPLFIAVIQGTEAEVKLILDNPNVDVNAKDGFGRTPLQCATARGDTGVLKLLLRNDNMDVNVRDENGQTAVLRATEKGQYDLTKLLLSNSKVDVDVKDKYGKTPLWHAVLSGKQMLVDLLLKHGAVNWGVQPITCLSKQSL